MLTYSDDPVKRPASLRTLSPSRWPGTRAWVLSFPHNCFKIDCGLLGGPNGRRSIIHLITMAPISTCDQRAVTPPLGRWDLFPEPLPG